MTAPVDPNVGRVLKGTYRIERLIGRGGMGAVYKAHHPKISKRYAIKLLLPELGRTDSASGPGPGRGWSGLANTDQSVCPGCGLHHDPLAMTLRSLGIFSRIRS